MRFTGILVLFLLILTGCSSTTIEETTPATNMPASNTPPVQTENIDYSSLGLTETEIKVWEEEGIANVDTAEAASALAGFKVITPGFIPPPLQRMSSYMVNDRNAKLSNAGIELQGDQLVTVTLAYSKGKEDKQIIIFIQSTQEMNVGQGESTELCGQTVEKRYTTDIETGGIQYVWKNNGICYVLNGRFSDDVNEAVLQQMLCSIISQ